MYLGIDVSQHQGNFSESLLDGKDFCMIRTGYGSENKEKQTDKYYLENVSKCIYKGIPYGFYHYSYAKNINMAVNEANFFLELVDKVSNTNNRPLYPLAYDVEDKALDSMDKEEKTEAILRVGQMVEDAGYYFIIYSSRYYFTTKLDLSKLERFDKWVADWTSLSDDSLQNIIKCGMRQYTVNRKENLDYNRAFKNYPAIINNMYNKNNKIQIKVGDTVKVKKAIQYDNGKSFKLWFDTYEVLEIYPKGSDRIVIGKNGVVTAAVNSVNLEVIKNV